jgi:hypothetical protein
MRRVLALSCRAFPPEHRARQSDEVVDTALLATDGSAMRAGREAFSLVHAGLRERLRGESQRSLRDGVGLLAVLLAVVNLAVALYRISFVVYSPPPILDVYGLGSPTIRADPRVFDWWWIAFPVAAVGIVLGLALGNRKLALGAALANLAIVAYDAIFLVSTWSFGHLWFVFGYARAADAYPIGQEWLAPAAVLALATAVAPLGHRSLGRLPVALGAAVLLIVISREISGDFLFLRWPVAVLVLLAVIFGAGAPRLTVVALGVSLALAATVVGYQVTSGWEYKTPFATWIAAPGLALGIVLPLAYLARRRLA